MKKYIELHKFFVSKSKYYCSPWTLGGILFYPIAYIKFMYYSFKENRQ